MDGGAPATQGCVNNVRVAVLLAAHPALQASQDYRATDSIVVPTQPWWAKGSEMEVVRQRHMAMDRHVTTSPLTAFCNHRTLSLLEVVHRG